MNKFTMLRRAIDLLNSSWLEEARDMGLPVDKFVWRLERNYPIPKIFKFSEKKYRTTGWDLWYEQERQEDLIYYENMENWILYHGGPDPIVIVEGANGEVADVWDGYHRAAAANYVGRSTIPAIVGTKDA